MKYRMSVFILVLFLSLSSCTTEQEESASLQTGTAISGDQGYTYKIQVEKMAFNWAVKDNQLHVKLSAETEGWIGIGFNPTEQMRDANFIIGFVQNGAVTVTDHHGVENKVHKEDTDLGGSSNVIAESGTEGPSGTEVAFAVPLSSEDTLDKPIDPDKDISVLLAYGRSDRLVQQHLMRSKLTVNLSSGKYTVMFVKGQV